MLDKDTIKTFGLVLTGSRFFGNAREDSDWDYISSINTGIILWAINNGFTLSNKETAGYPDSDLVLVNPDKKVHIQLCQNFQRKIEVNERLKPYLKDIPKQYHKIIWKLLLSK